MAKDRTDFDLVEIRTNSKVMLDLKIEKIYQFNPHRYYFNGGFNF